MIQVLFALNKTYLTNEKGALNLTKQFKKCPHQFSERVCTVLTKIGNKKETLRESIKEMQILSNELKPLVNVK